VFVAVINQINAAWQWETVHANRWRKSNRGFRSDKNASIIIWSV